VIQSGDALFPGCGLQIANLKISIADCFYPPPSGWPACYADFLFEKGSASFQACVQPGLDALQPDWLRLHPTHRSGGWQFVQDGSQLIFRFPAEPHRAFLTLATDADFQRIDVWPQEGALALLDNSGRCRTALIRRPIDQVLMMGLLAQHEGVVVHACGFSSENRAVLCPGVSGDGKSTLSRILEASGRGEVLSDERMILRAGQNEFHAWGTPWRSDGGHARNRSAPLAAICFLDKSPDNHLLPVTPADALRRLLKTASIPWFIPALRDKVLPVLDRLVSSVPAWQLGFTPGPEAARYIQALAENPESPSVCA